MKALLTTILAIGLAVSAWAALPPLIPRELLFGNPERDTPQLSPDGKLVAFRAPDTNGVMNVVVRTIGIYDDKFVTTDQKRGIRNLHWQQDGQHILYMQDKDGDENWHLYQTTIATRETRDLTPFPNVQATIVSANPNFPLGLLIGLNRRDPSVHDVYRLNLDSGESVLDTQNPGDVSEWVADNQFQISAATVLLPDGGTDIRVRDHKDNPWRSFMKWGPEETLGRVAGFSPDNKSLFVLTSQGAQTTRLLEVNLASKESRVLAEDPQFDVGDVVIHPTRRHVEAVSIYKAREEWKFLDETFRRDFNMVKGLVDGDHRLVSRDSADKHWVIGFNADNASVSYYTMERSENAQMYLFSTQDKLSRHRLARMKPVSFPARDGLTLNGYLTLPVGVPPTNLPLVINVHGGPWGRDMWGLDPEAQWLANRGYAVLQVNFRGSTGYGKKHLNAGDREWGGRMQDDILDAKKWAVQQNYADPKRVAIFGGSYGGYAVLAGLAFAPDEFACGIELFGPSNLETLLKSIPPYWAPMKSLFARRVGDVDKEPDFLRSRSPLFKADQIKAPLLIAQGANDPRVKMAESDQIVAAMRKNNKPVQYLVFPDEGHGFARPDNRLKFYAAAEQFLERHLRGRYEPPSDNEKWDALLK